MIVMTSTSKPACDHDPDGFPTSAGSRWRGLGASLASALAGALVVGAAWAGFALFAPDHPVQSDKGDLRVSYMIQTSPTSAEGSTIEDVSRIDFQPGYVVVTRRDGSGHVFFSQTTRSLSWTK